MLRVGGTPTAATTRLRAKKGCVATLLPVACNGGAESDLVAELHLLKPILQQIVLSISRYSLGSSLPWEAPRKSTIKEEEEKKSRSGKGCM